MVSCRCINISIILCVLLSRPFINNASSRHTGDILYHVSNVDIYSGCWDVLRDNRQRWQWQCFLLFTGHICSCPSDTVFLWSQHKFQKGLISRVASFLTYSLLIFYWWAPWTIKVGKIWFSKISLWRTVKHDIAKMLLSNITSWFIAGVLGLKCTNVSS